MSTIVTPRRGVSRLVLALVLAAALLVVGGIAMLAPAGAAACTPSPIGNDELSHYDVTATDGSTEISAWESVRASLRLDLADGHCGGDSTTVTLPDQLAEDLLATSGDLADADGNVVATWTRSGSDITITLTDFVETRQAVWVEACGRPRSRPSSRPAARPRSSGRRTA